MRQFEVRVVVSAESAEDAVSRVIRTDGDSRYAFVTDMADPAKAEETVAVPNHLGNDHLRA